MIGPEDMVYGPYPQDSLNSLIPIGRVGMLQRWRAREVVSLRLNSLIPIGRVGMDAAAQETGYLIRDVSILSNPDRASRNSISRTARGPSC